MQSPYLIPKAAVSNEETIKRSRFITYLSKAETPKLAKQWLLQIKQCHPVARHHCWAMVAGDPKDSLCLGFSDDGEPSGTAGKPMLAQLQGSGIGQIACVIVRYSGGIKLGTGGLVRAYGQGVAQALAKLETSDFIPSCKLLLQGSYDDSGRIERFLSSNNIEVVERSFEAQTRWIVKLGIQQRAQTEARLIQLCSGNIEIQGL